MYGTKTGVLKYMIANVKDRLLADNKLDEAISKIIALHKNVNEKSALLPPDIDLAFKTNTFFEIYEVELDGKKY